MKKDEGRQLGEECETEESGENATKRRPKSRGEGRGETGRSLEVGESVSTMSMRRGTRNYLNILIGC